MFNLMKLVFSSSRPCDLRTFIERFWRWMTHQDKWCQIHSKLTLETFLSSFSSSRCSAAAVIWKVFADVACTGRTPPCQLPHLERPRFGKQSGEEGGLFSMPAYMKKSSVRPRGQSASSERFCTKIILLSSGERHKWDEFFQIGRKSPKTPDRFC